MKTLALTALLLASSARASDWTPADTAFEAAGATLHLLDWSQTVRLGRMRPYSAGGMLVDPGHETNPILGERPGAAKVTGYFAGTLLAHAAVARLLPPPYRRTWQAVWIGVEGYCVGYNFATGVRLDFP